MVVTINIHGGSAMFSDRKVILAEGSPLVIEGFPAELNGWVFTADNGFDRHTFEVSGGAVTIPARHALLRPGILQSTARKFKSGIAVAGIAIEPLALVEDNDGIILRPAIDVLLERLGKIEARLKTVEDTQFGFDFNL